MILTAPPKKAKNKETKITRAFLKGGSVILRVILKTTPYICNILNVS
jgi:hypothetical protein